MLLHVMHPLEHPVSNLFHKSGCVVRAFQCNVFKKITNFDKGALARDLRGVNRGCYFIMFIDYAPWRSRPSSGISREIAFTNVRSRQNASGLSRVASETMYMAIEAF